MSEKDSFTPSDVSSHRTHGGKVFCRFCGNPVWVSLNCTDDEIAEAREDHIQGHLEGWINV